MKTCQIAISDERDKALNIVAAKDNMGVEEVIQKQIDYYGKCVLDSFSSNLSNF